MQAQQIGEREDVAGSSIDVADTETLRALQDYFRIARHPGATGALLTNCKIFDCSL
jgi:hypothetical protein